MTFGKVIWRQKSLTIYYCACRDLCFCYRSSPHRHLSEGCHCNFCVIDEEIGQCIWSLAQQTSWGSPRSEDKLRVSPYPLSRLFKLGTVSLKKKTHLFFFSNKYNTIQLLPALYVVGGFGHILPCLDPASIGRWTVSLDVLLCRVLCFSSLSFPLSPLCFHLGLGCAWNLGLLPQSFCC